MYTQVITALGAKDIRWKAPRSNSYLFVMSLNGLTNNEPSGLYQDAQRTCKIMDINDIKIGFFSFARKNIIPLIIN